MRQDTGTNLYGNKWTTPGNQNAKFGKAFVYENKDGTWFERTDNGTEILRLRNGQKKVTYRDATKK